MDEDALLSVGFAIDFHDSFGQLRSLDDIVGDVAANTFREFQRIENASKGAIQMGNATAQVTAFGNAATRELAEVTRESNRVERAGEGIVRQMNRQIEVFGKNASEIRQMRAEMRAVEAESRGFTELAGRIRIASAELDRLEASGTGVTRAFNRGSHTMMQFGMQGNDIITMAMLGAPPMQIFASQIGQIVQVVQGAEGGMKGFASELGGVLLKFGPVIAIVAGAAAAFGLFSRSVSDIDTQPMIDSLGLTRAEIEQLENTSVGAGDVIKATFQEIAERLGINMADVKGFFSDAMDFLTRVGRQTLAGLHAMFAGTIRSIAVLFQGLASGKSFDEILTGMGDAYKDSFNEADKALIQFGKDVQDRIRDNKLDDLRRQAREIKADRSASANNHAESLMREVAAIEAQIGNLYALADAYRVSGAEALVAEARVKAESQAIKNRGEIAAFVERAVRLEIAQRVSDAAKATAAVREQAAAQREVNAMVTGGLVPAERAAEMVQERIAELPLLAAIEVAKERGYVEALAQSTHALSEHRAAREALRLEEAKAAGQAAIAGMDDRIALMKEELRLVGETVEVRERELALFLAMQEARGFTDGNAHTYIARKAEVFELERQIQLQTEAANAAIRHQIELFELLVDNVVRAGRGMADAFGETGRALGDVSSSFAIYMADQRRLESIRNNQLALAEQISKADQRAMRIQQINAQFSARNMTAQIGLFGDMADAAKGFFAEGTAGYKAMETAEKAFRAVEFALSVRAIAQDAIETGSKIANSVARTATFAVEAVVKAIKELPWPINLVAGAATAGAIAALGVSIAGSFGGGGGSQPEPANEGRGTVFGDPEAQSQSIKRSIDALREVDMLTATYSREMLGSLRSIDSQIGGLANVLIRTGNVDANFDIAEGFKSDTIGKVLKGVVTGGGLFTKIPVIGDILGAIGGFLGSLFGSKKSVTGSGLYAEPQTLGEILSGGFDASYYTDIKKKRKFFGITTGTSYSTEYQNASGELENEFTLILRGFSDAIAAAAGPLGVATSTIAQRLQGFVINIGKIDTRNMTGAELQSKLTAIFGAAADRMALSAFPVIAQFQRAGEGAFETMVRVASTVETVTGVFDQLGMSVQGVDIAAQMALVDQFDGLEGFTSATQAYFDTFYTREEQAQAKLAQFTAAFERMGITLPDTLAGFRALVEAQDLTTAAGRETYAMLLQVAPAFADLKSALNGARSAADILAERQDLERRLLELQGNTEALRALDLAKLDASNRALQEQIWAVEDAQEAARAAEQLRDAWTSVGDSIMDEVRRIRGLTGTEEGGSFATLMGQFNAATAAARGGDLDAAKSLPGLSQALLKAAELAATSRQELDRIRAQAAASLEATNAAIAALGNSTSSDDAVVAAAAAAQTANGATNDNQVESLRTALDEVRAELAALRAENNAGHAANASNTGAIKRKLDDVTAASGGDAISTVAAA